jgi:hypothetical protein
VEKIKKLINFITTSDCNIVCLQGINDTKLLKLIVKYIFISNLESTSDKKLTTYPMLDTFCLTSDIDIIKVTWSNSDDDNSLNGVNSLIISKENIISGSILKITSFELKKLHGWIYVANIEWNGIIVSVYNATFQSNFVGVSNNEIRKIQIKELNTIVLENTKNINQNDEYANFGNKNINIICCQSNIQELLNNDINGEYLYFTRTLKSLDTYRYVQSLKGKQLNIPYDATDISGSRNNYILLSNLDTIGFEKIENIGDMLYEKYNILVINSKIQKFKLFEDNMIITSFLSKQFEEKEIQKKLTAFDEIAVEIV